jgi:hypothetical protein
MLQGACLSLDLPERVVSVSHEGCSQTHRTQSVIEVYSQPRGSILELPEPDDRLHHLLFRPFLGETFDKGRFVLITLRVRPLVHTGHDSREE